MTNIDIDLLRTFVVDGAFSEDRYEAHLKNLGAKFAVTRPTLIEVIRRQNVLMAQQLRDGGRCTVCGKFVPFNCGPVDDRGYRTHAFPCFRGQLPMFFS